jgi:SAM-dependent methyltransferase
MRLSQALSTRTPSDQVFETFDRIFELDEAAGSSMRAFLGFGSERDAVQRFIQYSSDVVALTRRPLEGQRILDAGCSYGLFLVVCGLYGARSLHGVDVDSDAIGFSDVYREILPADVAGKLHLQVGDVTQLPHQNASFDVVTSIEAVSHYLDVHTALEEFSRVLRPGGVLVISDGNNGRNPRYARTIHELWVAAEEGPGHRVIGGHAVGKPYRERRAELIQDHSPGLSDADIARLAVATSGYVRQEILEAVDVFESSGAEPVPKRSSTDVPVDPDGATHERLFDPYELAEDLTEHGFRDVHVEGYWGGANGRLSVRVANALLSTASRLTIPTAKGFRVAAVKR